MSISLRNTSESYGSLAKWFHWIGAVLIIGMLIYGTIFTTLISKGPIKHNLIQIHKSFGLLILVFILIRWFWRWLNPIPNVLSVQHPFLKKGVRYFHELLYVAILVMLVSGILMTASHHYPIPFFNLFTIQTTWFPKNKSLGYFFNRLHLIAAWTLAIMVLLHCLAVLKHHFYYKDETLKRML